MSTRLSYDNVRWNMIAKSCKKIDMNKNVRSENFKAQNNKKNLLQATNKKNCWWDNRDMVTARESEFVLMLAENNSITIKYLKSKRDRSHENIKYIEIKLRLLIIWRSKIVNSIKTCTNADITWSTARLRKWWYTQRIENESLNLRQMLWCLCCCLMDISARNNKKKKIRDPSSNSLYSLSESYTFIFSLSSYVINSQTDWVL